MAVRGDSDNAPAWLVRAAAVGGRLLVLGVLVWLLAELAGELTLLLVGVLVALLLAGVLTPAVEWAAGRGVRRGVAAAVAVALLLLVIGAVTAGLASRVVSEAPELREQLMSAANEVSRTLGIDVPVAGGTGGGDAKAPPGPDAVPGAVSSARVLVDVVVGFFLTFALTFLFLKDGARMWRWVLSKLGGAVRDDTDAAGRAAWATAGAYVRGLTVVALFDAAAIGAGLLLLGVPLALTLAALQFLASYVPTIGAVVAGLVAVGVAYAAGGLVKAALVLGLVVVVQQIGNLVIEPFVLNRALPLNAAMVLVAVTAGGLLWGIAGALLFVPLAAAASAAAHVVWTRRGSRPVAGGS